METRLTIIREGGSPSTQGTPISSPVRPSLNVRLLLDFEQDDRPSMEVYASSLLSALRACAPPDACIEPYRPAYPFRAISVNPWVDRFARYCSYPLQIRGIRPEVNHIIDHGYAHLLATLPPRNTVITVHDLIPLVAHRGKIPGLRRRRPLLSELSAKFLNRARFLIADSRQTKIDLVELCSTPEDLVHVIPLGLSSEFRPLNASKARLRAKLSLDAKDCFLIMISGTHFYKNHEVSLAVLRALRQHSSADCKVLWIGNRDATNDSRVTALGLTDAVIGLKPSTVRQVVELYNAADCLLFPSLYEGFGWPPLEAMGCGTPVVCSNAGSLPEVVGDAALVTTSNDVDGFVDHLQSLMHNKSKRELLIEKGLKRATLFPWGLHAKAVWEIYRQVIQ